MKKMIAAFTRRSQESFQDENGDQLLVAINHAKDFAQRGVDLERAYVQTIVTMSDASQPAKLTNAKLYPDNQEAVEIKCVRKAFLRDGTSGFERPIDVVSRQSYVDQLGRKFKGLGVSPSSSDVIAAINEPNACCVLAGDSFFLYPLNSAVIGSVTNLAVYFDAIKWIPDFSDSGETSFLFTYCADFIMFRSIFELNFLLKEDQRFNVSMTVLADVWQSLKDWNSKTIGNAVDDVSLD